MTTRISGRSGGMSGVEYPPVRAGRDPPDRVGVRPPGTSEPRRMRVVSRTPRITPADRGRVSGFEIPRTWSGDISVGRGRFDRLGKASIETSTTGRQRESGGFPETSIAERDLSRPGGMNPSDARRPAAPSRTAPAPRSRMSVSLANSMDNLSRTESRRGF